MSDRAKAVVIIVTGSLITGAMVPSIKIGLESIPPYSFSFMRFFLSSLVMLPFFLRAGVKANRHLSSLITTTLFAVANVVLFIIGIQRTTASIGQMLYSGTPIAVGVLMLVLFGRKMSRARWMAIALGMAGTVLVIAQPVFAAGSPYIGTLWGNGTIAVAVVTYSLYQIYSKRIQKVYSPLVITAMFMFMATAVFLILSLSEIAETVVWLQSASHDSIVALLFVVFSTLVGYVFNQYAIKFGGPLIASLGFYLLPPISYFWAFVLLGEQLTMGLIAGTLIVFVSIALTANTKSVSQP